MSSIIRQILNYGLFFIFIFSINSCAHFKIQKLNKKNNEPINFYEFLGLEYLEFAKYELYEMHDEIDANYFAYKASLALNENKFFPEDPKNWAIPKIYIEEANLMYNRINKLINSKLFNKYPEEFSKMIAGYDCWIEQIEENWQFDHIELCLNKFNQNFIFINEKLISNKKKLEKNNKSENSIENKKESNLEKYKKTFEESIIEDTKALRTIVFFEFDKFTLSSNQVIELEKFITIAKKNINMRIIIEGHTDTMGSKSYNSKLSKNRANFIKKYLMNRNLNNNIEIKAYGETNLLVETSDEVKEKQNRRAELFFK